MNAADVLADAWKEWRNRRPAATLPTFQSDALLAHGEQGKGVTIRGDGGLVPELPDGHVRIDGDVYRVDTEDLGDPFGNKAYLFLVSAEAGDTKRGMMQEWDPTIIEAEAGDTDG